MIRISYSIIKGDEKVQRHALISDLMQIKQMRNLMLYKRFRILIISDIQKALAITPLSLAAPCLDLRQGVNHMGMNQWKNL